MQLKGLGTVLIPPLYSDFAQNAMVALRCAVVFRIWPSYIRKTRKINIDTERIIWSTKQPGTWKVHWIRTHTERVGIARCAFDIHTNGVALYFNNSAESDAQNRRIGHWPRRTAKSSQKSSSLPRNCAVQTPNTRCSYASTLAANNHALH